TPDGFRDGVEGLGSDFLPRRAPRGAERSAVVAPGVEAERAAYLPRADAIGGIGKRAGVPLAPAGDSDLVGEDRPFAGLSPDLHPVGAHGPASPLSELASGDQ